MIKTIIAAVAENGVIGVNNRLPWRLSDDLKHFKKITFGHFVIMGMHTFISIGEPLKGRTNIILSRNLDRKIQGAITLSSLSDALKYAENNKQKEVFIIGGADIYRQVIHLADRIYLTKVEANPEGDIRFPHINWNDWIIRSKSDFRKNEKNEFSFQILQLDRGR